MKTYVLLFLSAQFMIILFWTCSGERKEIKDQIRAATRVCYKAIAERDTTWDFEEKVIGLEQAQLVADKLLDTK